MDEKIEFFVSIFDRETQVKSRVVDLDIKNMESEMEVKFKVLQGRVWSIKLYNDKYSEYEDIDFDEHDMLRKGGKLLAAMQPRKETPAKHSEVPSTSQTNPASPSTPKASDNTHRSPGVGRYGFQYHMIIF